MYYILYKTTNTLNGKIYVGVHKTKNLDDGYLGSGKVLKRAIKKYGEENFTREILEKFETAEDMYQMESVLVNEDFVKRKDTYNLKEGGNGGFDYINKNRDFKEHNQKLADNRDYSKTDKSYINDEYRKKLSDISKALIAEGIINPGVTFLGMKHTEETKKKIGRANAIHQMGENNSNYGKTRCINNKNPNISKMFLKEAIPHGWITAKEFKESKKQKNNSAYGKHWYNNGEKSFLLNPNDNKVKDLIKGRI